MEGRKEGRPFPFGKGERVHVLLPHEIGGGDRVVGRMAYIYIYISLNVVICNNSLPLDLQHRGEVVA